MAQVISVDKKPPLTAKRAFLMALVVSVVISTVLGAVSILAGSFGWFEIRVILTTIVIAVSGVGGLACAAALAVDGARKRRLPTVGIGLTIIAGAMIGLGIWIQPESVAYWKTAASSAVFAVACAHLSLLSMARLASWFQWSLTFAYVVILGVATLITVLIFSGPEMEGMFHLLGVAAVVDAGITVLIPIFHKLSRTEVVVSEYDPPSAKQAALDGEILRLEKQIAELRRMRGD